MAKIHIHQWFRASPATVFEHFHLHDRLGELWPGRFRRIRDAAGDDPDGAGSVREIRAPGLRLLEQVDECDPPHRIVYHICGGTPLIRSHRGEMRFWPEGAGTVLDYRIELQARAGLTPLLAMALERALTPGIRRLAQRYERNAPDAQRWSI